MTSNRFNIENASTLYKKIADYQNINPIIKTNILSYVARNSEEVSEEVEGQVHHRIEDLEKQLEEVDAKKILQALTQLLAIPHEYISEKQEDYLKLLKDHLSFGLTRHYLEILSSFN